MSQTMGVGASPFSDPEDDLVVDVHPRDQVAVERVEAWFREYGESGDPKVREKIILAYIGLADRLADRFRGSRGVTREDLRQIARMGLVAAVDRYDSSRANPFVPYAIACIVGELKRYLRDATWRVHIARSLKERALQVCQALDQLPQTLGRSPTIAELAGHVGATEEEVIEAIDVAQTRSAASLDQLVGEDNGTSLGELLPADGPREQFEDLYLLPKLVADLPQIERSVIILRYFEDLTQDEIAARVGYSQMHVSRLLRRALDRIRSQLVE